MASLCNDLCSKYIQLHSTLLNLPLSWCLQNSCFFFLLSIKVTLHLFSSALPSNKQILVYKRIISWCDGEISVVVSLMSAVRQKCLLKTQRSLKTKAGGGTLLWSWRCTNGSLFGYCRMAHYETSSGHDQMIVNSTSVRLTGLSENLTASEQHCQNSCLPARCNLRWKTQPGFQFVLHGLQFLRNCINEPILLLLL